jgi:protein-disulfide isomerase
MSTLALAALSGYPANVQADTFDAAEEAAIGEIVREYLLENPEVVYEAIQILQEREQAAQAQRREEGLKAQRAALEDPGMLPVLGNPDGDVTLVEFFDYRCGYCRAVANDVLAAVEEDGNVRLIMREFPILGEDSVEAARVALAASKQDVYQDFHMRLMTEVSGVNAARALALAAEMGLDMERLHADMQAPEINAELRRSFQIAEALDINGTPAFVIGGELVPGAVSREQIEDLIAEARAGG